MSWHVNLLPYCPASPAAWCPSTATPSLVGTSTSQALCTSARSSLEVSQHMALPCTPVAVLTLLTAVKNPPLRQFMCLADSFDSVSAAQFGEEWLLRAGDQVIPNPVSFLNVTAYKTTVPHGATLQGVDLTRLVGATFTASQPVTLHSPFTFRKYLMPPPAPPA